ncbi:TlpA family protein disulfide reductase [Paenibacillus athensensis]|uniref:Thioredoxin domain-containing protein n=1 Tax=Paenibacillus athensensis TaxID=1967502 RepID=A0A4Y8Q261_9BACL|nr:TlpA disulfide reductase family protein [Paenibacillus athensensis]MCD1261050.1 TlpA family protein disulfide reductase [Paenibacillus athensensis]
MRTWVQYGILLMLVALFVYTGVRFVQRTDTVQVGEAAPAFQLETIAGGTVSLEQYKGQPVVLNFFTTWCGPCVEELPELKKFHARYGDRYPLLVVDRREPKERVTAFAASNQAPLHFLLDYRDDVSKSYGIKGQPETMIVDAQGVVRRYIIGGLTAEELAREVQASTAATTP